MYIEALWMYNNAWWMYNKVLWRYNYVSLSWCQWLCFLGTNWTKCIGLQLWRFWSICVQLRCNANLNVLVNNESTSPMYFLNSPSKSGSKLKQLMKAQNPADECANLYIWSNRLGKTYYQMRFIQQIKKDNMSKIFCIFTNFIICPKF